MQKIYECKDYKIYAKCAVVPRKNYEYLVILPPEIGREIEEGKRRGFRGLSFNETDVLAMGTGFTHNRKKYEIILRVLGKNHKERLEKLITFIELALSPNHCE